MAEMPGMRRLTRLLFGQHLIVHLGMTGVCRFEDARFTIGVEHFKDKH